jgi:hypothetical protein
MFSASGMIFVGKNQGRAPFGIDAAPIKSIF